MANDNAVLQTKCSCQLIKNACVTIKNPNFNTSTNI